MYFSVIFTDKTSSGMLGGLSGWRLGIRGDSYWGRQAEGGRCNVANNGGVEIEDTNFGDEVVFLSETVDTKDVACSYA